MFLEPPARIAVLGAGPIGLEVALYARYLGYEVDVYEHGQRVSENLRRWGHITLFTPFRMNCTTLGVAAIRAQDPNWNPPDAEALLSGEQLCSRYLLPLAETDLIADSMHLNTEVLSIGRSDYLKGEAIGDPARGDAEFSLLLRDSTGKTFLRHADAVIDCTGTYGNHNWPMGKSSMACPISWAATEPVTKAGTPCSSAPAIRRPLAWSSFSAWRKQQRTSRHKSPG